MPGPEKPLLHIAIEFVEMLDNALAEHQMLNVAHGELPRFQLANQALWNARAFGSTEKSGLRTRNAGAVRNR